MNNNDEWFVVKNLKEFIESSRALVFNNFGKKEEENDITTAKQDLLIDAKDQEELDQVLSYKESEAIVKQFLRKQTNAKGKKNKDSSIEVRYLVSDKIFMDIIYSLNDRMVSNLLNSLVNRGLIETAYDSDSEDFVFWVKNETNENKEEPETD